MSIYQVIYPDGSEAKTQIRKVISFVTGEAIDMYGKLCVIKQATLRDPVDYTAIPKDPEYRDLEYRDKLKALEEKLAANPAIANLGKVKDDLMVIPKPVCNWGEPCYVLDRGTWRLGKIHSLEYVNTFGSFMWIYRVRIDNGGRVRFRNVLVHEVRPA